jgi:hypothetical protein
MKRIGVIMNIRQKSVQLEIKLVEENKNALLSKEKLELRVTKLMVLEKMLIIYNMNWQS